VKWPSAWELVGCNRGSWKGAAVQRGLEPGSRGLAVIRSRYQATTSEDTAGWKRERDFVKCGNSDSVIVIFCPVSGECKRSDQ
jgi:hypothetical protein